MKNYLSISDLAMWIGLIAGQLVLCLCVLKQRLPRRLPWFSTFIFTTVAENLLLFAIAFMGSYTAYYYVFFVADHLVSVAAFLTLIEFGRQVLPGLDLPRKKSAIAWLLVALTGVVVFACAWPMRVLANRLEVAAYLAIATTFMFITIYSHYLGLYWSRLLGGVSFPLGLLYFTNGAVEAITWHYPLALALQIRLLSQVVNIIAVVIWTVVVLSPWGERKMTEEDLRKFQEIVGAMRDDWRRFAAGGSR